MPSHDAWRLRAEEYRAMADCCSSVAGRAAYESLAKNCESIADRMQREPDAAPDFWRSVMPTSPPRNGLLSALPPADYLLLRPQLEQVKFGLRYPFEIPETSTEHIYFVEQGLASVVAADRQGREIEVGLIGCEGMTGVGVVLGDERSSHSTYCQAAGSALRIDVRAFRTALGVSNTLHALLLRYAQVLLVQTRQTAFANGRAKIETRLARWLLMSQDRIGSNALPLTHEFLSIMLGVRRAGVTMALHELEGRGVIHSDRGHVAIVDRRGLEGLAGDTYGFAESAYRRLIGGSPNGALNGAELVGSAEITVSEA